jgi:hypothetical protein
MYGVSTRIAIPSSSSLGEYDLLISLEEAIRESIGDYATVDGHDIGSGEMNIFLFTGNPKLAFEQIKRIPSVAVHILEMKVGYREINEDEYTPLYPEGLQKFEVV